MIYLKSTAAVPWGTLVCTIAFLSIVAVVRAQEPIPETITPPQEGSARLENRLEARTEAVTERRELREEAAQERRTTLNEGLQNRFLNLVDNASNRIEAALLRLTNVSERLASRLNKLESAGIDVTVPRSTLAIAQAKLIETEYTLSNARMTATDTLRGESARENFIVVKSAFKNATEDLREVFRLLRQVIAETKTAVALEAGERGVSSAVSNTPSEGVTSTE